MPHLQIDDPITFKFNCTFEFSSAKPRREDYFDQEFDFNMVYDCGTYPCRIEIWQKDRRNAKRANQVDWSVLFDLTLPDEPCEVLLSAIIYDSKQNEIFSETRVTMLFEASGHHRCIPKGECPIAKSLRKCHRLPKVTRCHVDLCALVTVPRKLFAFDPYFRNLVPPPPTVEDYRFDSLRNTSRQDVLIHCLDGTITACREALFHVSAHFRDSPREMVENASCQAVNEFLCFMMTETWSHSGHMNRQHAVQLLQLIKKHKPMRGEKLFDSIEHHLLWQLYENRHDLRHVLDVLVVALRAGAREFARLDEVSMALLYHLHRNQYLMDFASATAANRADHELIEELHVEPSPNTGKPSIHGSLCESFEETRHVQLIIENNRFRLENE